jgi:hypothetical protein
MSKRPIRIVFFSIMVVILITAGWKILQSFRAVDAQQKLIRTLNTNDISYLTLYPNYDPNSLLDDSVNIYDRQIIAQLVSAYKHMRPQGAGDGKLSGQWQLTVTFITYDHRQIKSDIYHNEYSDLVFISTAVASERQNIDAMLASNELSQILLNALARK